jgi:TolB-like protein
MSENPGKNFHFWKELKRRNVLRSLAIYAGTAFIILEATTILFPRWDLPDWSIDLVFWLLVLGAVINVFIAWFFDITPQGMQMTKPLEEVTESEPRAESKAWRVATYLSLAVIIGLIVLNILRNPNSLHAGDIQSLVILPFENYTGDEEFDNMVASMHSLLTGDIGRISGLRVIGKTSAGTYKGVDKTATEIASELDVEGVLETTVTCLGDNICMQFRLVNAVGKEEQIWVAEYSEDKGQILDLNNRVTRQIADELMIELTSGEEQMLAKSRTADREAVDAFLKGYVYLEDLHPDALYKALDFLNQAVKKDPEWAPPYAGLTLIWAALAQMSAVTPEVAGPFIFTNLSKALELDPNLPETYFVQAGMAVWTEWNWQKGEQAFLKGIAANPNDEMARIYYAHLLMILNRPDEAYLQGQLAARLDPKNALIQALFAPVVCEAHGWEAGYNQVQKALELDPTNYFANQFLDQFAISTGHYDQAMEGLFLALDFTDEAKAQIQKIYKEDGIYHAYDEVLSQLEQNSLVGPVDMAGRYALVNRHDKALEYIEAGYEAHDPNLPYLTTRLFCNEPLYTNPRFIAVVEKMGLTIPER